LWHWAHAFAEKSTGLSREIGAERALEVPNRFGVFDLIVFPPPGTIAPEVAAVSSDPDGQDEGRWAL